jgi:hypothetical protein
MSDIETRETPMVVVEPPVAEDELLREAMPGATSDDLTGAMTGCVVHLCGCK